uniref:DNA (cytosine-5-)-methyltransferase n=1 Tax=Tigriopus japonicus TaxID=158387 RepID=A0A0N7E4T5_TIGJA|nr:DNA (cytosine-5)-methyltransferase [Tigriopus japonicus]
MSPVDVSDGEIVVDDLPEAEEQPIEIRISAKPGPKSKTRLIPVPVEPPPQISRTPSPILRRPGPKSRTRPQSASNGKKRRLGPKSRNRSTGNQPSQSSSTTKNCPECHGRSDQVQWASPCHEVAVGEAEAIRDKLIAVEGSERDRPQAFLADFSVMDTRGHLVSFWDGLVDRGRKLYMNGLIKSVFSDPDSVLGVYVRQAGPIVQWWTTGFNKGENVVIGVSTDWADYHLQLPSLEYARIMKNLQERTILTKMVFEIADSAFETASDITYEDMLIQMEADAPKYGLDYFSEEHLLNNARFIVDHIGSFEEAGQDDDDEEDEALRLIDSSCMAKLVQYSGQLDRLRDKKSEIKRSKKSKKRTVVTAKKSIVKRTFSKATTTPLIRYVFESVFKHQIAVDLLNQGSNLLLNGSSTEPPTKLKKLKPAEVCFTGPVINLEGQTKFYEAVEVAGTRVQIGGYVAITSELPETPDFIGRIIYLFDDGAEQLAHVRYFCRGQDTVLGMTSDPDELFLTDECEDVSISDLVEAVEVEYRRTSSDWAEYSSRDIIEIECDGFWYRFKYQAKFARFEVVPQVEDSPDEARFCHTCHQFDEDLLKRTPRVLNGALLINGDQYEVGDACLIDPEALPMSHVEVKVQKTPYIPKEQQVKDPEQYPEFFRFQFSKQGVRQSNDDNPDPFRIGIIEHINSNIPEVQIKIRKILRPEHTFVDPDEANQQDLHYVIFSNEFSFIEAKSIRGKCHLCPKQLLQMDPSEWFEGGTNRFYFDRTYNSFEKVFEDLSPDVIERFSNLDHVHESGALPQISRPLNTLDVFAGCGGLSVGLEQSGVSLPLWAIENSEAPAIAFKLSNPDCTVFHEDCNAILKNVMDGHTHDQEGRQYPQRGQVELMAAGPPCQGFSRMNIFSEREYSQFKNSLIATYLSYCDYYRPKYVILENVMNLAMFKKNLVLKLCFRALLMMGYQCTFGIMQAGHFGVPQTRRRCILLAAAPTEILPNYPTPRHVFAKSALGVNVDDKLFTANVPYMGSAPYRTITVRDAIGDLPPIQNGDNILEKSYSQPPKSHFQRRMRRSDKLQDHICRKMAPLIEMRMSLVPQEPGSDWRDLPNIEIQLSDGTFSEKLKYLYRDYASPKSSRLRGVCPCNADKSIKCDGLSIQGQTIIPWCLPHTANRNGNWAGLYGRINWDGHFPTTVTNPEPISKQGRVLHPVQNRVVSVRECARSQGFPDDYQFYGTIMEKHRQIGNAVPPPLARAIGAEILLSIAKNNLNGSS